ncbi:PH domain-containing protein [uncultured Croceitalea sp.]|uniref:PH domain-containing protein n=1 Tax=uncultured Croceitalea sp. TaxID=1798908 RepID=UPI003305BEDA
MNYKFRNKKGKLLIIVTAIVALLSLFILYLFFTQGIWLFTLILLVYLFLILVYLLWILNRTSYEVIDNILKYRSGFNSGKIHIDTISKIEINKTKWIGLKPSTASKGMIIHYNKYDSIYISPIDNSIVAVVLREINPSIRILN